MQSQKHEGHNSSSREEKTREAREISPSSATHQRTKAAGLSLKAEMSTEAVSNKGAPDGAASPSRQIASEGRGFGW